jgi:DNA modification methylase
LHPSNAGQLQWGEAYRLFHAVAWTEVYRVLVPGGRFILNISDHIRDRKVVPVSKFHVEVIRDLGFTLQEQIVVPTPRLRQGANRERVEHENIFVFERQL